MKSRDVPNTLAHGWGGMGSQSVAPPMACFAALPRTMSPMSRKMAMPQAQMMRQQHQRPAMSCDGPPAFGFGAAPAHRSFVQADADMSFDSAPPMCGKSLFHTAPESMVDHLEASSPSMTDNDKLLKLISIQSFDGSFKLLESLAELLNTSIEDIREGSERYI